MAEENIPKHIIKYNRKLRSKLEKKQAAFKEAGEKMKGLRSTITTMRREARQAAAQIDKLQKSLDSTAEELAEFKALHAAVTKDLLRLRKDTVRAHDQRVAKEKKRKDALETLAKIKEFLK